MSGDEGHDVGDYVAPELTDYGSLGALTLASGLFGTEDGASKLVPFHHVPTPSAPTGP